MNFPTNERPSVAFTPAGGHGQQTGNQPKRKGVFPACGMGDTADQPDPEETVHLHPSHPVHPEGHPAPRGQGRKASGGPLGTLRGHQG